jgi:hypothetical protein
MHVHVILTDVWMANYTAPVYERAPDVFAPRWLLLKGSNVRNAINWLLELPLHEKNNT